MLQLESAIKAIDRIIRGERRRMKKQIDDAIRNLIPHQVNRKTVSQWAEEKRILPRGLTSMPGPFRWNVTPYLREIADCFSESSPVQKVAVMKGARLGFSVGVGENWIGYVVDCAPGPMLFVGADKESAEMTVELRIDPMLQFAALEDKIFAQTEKTHQKKTGDTKSKKEFVGGFLLVIGPRSGSKLRSQGIRYIVFDEVDSYPQSVGGGDPQPGRKRGPKTANEGDPITLAERRTDEYERIRKILYLSTPTTEHSSRIKKLFEAGDQRYYHVPCKHCGQMQRLRWRDDKGEYRLKYEVDEKGILVEDSVYYECEKCGGHWKDEDKATFLELGKWIPSATAIEPNMRSYHLSALYAPAGMRTWKDICREWVNKKNDPLQLRVFMNTVLGETWIELGKAPQWQFIKLRNDHEYYEPGTLPENAKPLLVTIGADTQDDRIEAEVIAWGKDKESWSIDYQTFEGETGDPGDPCWKKFNEFINSEHAGFHSELTLIDARGHRTTQVYDFCEQYTSGVMPCMGDDSVRQGKQIFMVRDVAGYDLRRIDLDVSALKHELYEYLMRGVPKDREHYPHGYCHFPKDEQKYGERYLRQLTSETYMDKVMETGKTKSVWHLPSGRRNEALDVRVYAMGAIYVIRYDISLRFELENEISWLEFWKYWEK